MTALFSATDLADMRAFSEANMPHTCAVQQNVRTRVTGGTYVDNWTTVVGYGTVKCRLAPAGTPAKKSVADMPRAVNTYEVAVPVGTPVGTDPKYDYRLVVTHDVAGLASPLTVNVVGVEDHTYQMERTVLAERAA